MSFMLKIWVLLALLAPQLQAVVPAAGAFYRGDGSPGRLVDSTGRHNLSQTSDPGNPSSPTPFGGSNWLCGGPTAAGDYEVPLDTISDYSARQVYEWGARVDAGATLNYFWIWYNGGSWINAITGVDNGDGTWHIRYFENSGGQTRFTADLSTGVTHHIRFEMPAVGASDGTLYIDCAAVVTGITRTDTLIPSDHFELCNFSSDHFYMDEVMVAEGWGDTYPGPSCVVNTPTYTITPTPTVTPTASRTPSPTPSSTPTASPTPTATPLPLLDRPLDDGPEVPPWSWAPCPKQDSCS